MNKSAFAPIIWLLACASDDSAPNQLLIRVDADDSVVGALERLEVALYRPGSHADSAPERTQRFDLTRERPTGGLVRLPFTFGLQRGQSREIQTVFRGYSERDGAVVIERKVIASFEPAGSTDLNVYLSGYCFGVAAVCPELEQTCAPSTTEHGRAGACVPVHQADPEEDAPSGSAPDVATREQSSTVAPEDARCDGAISCPDDYPCELAGGQPTCRGQFADWPVRAEPADFDVETVDGVVIDRVTGLVWQRELPETYAGCTGRDHVLGDACRFLEAVQYCEQLELAGSRFRLPTKVELESLIGDALPGAAGGSLWSASRLVTDPNGAAWQVDPELGRSRFAGQDHTARVRCVRSGQRAAELTPKRYVIDREADTVADTRTELAWQRSYGRDVSSFEEAHTYCEEKGAGWRLPTIEQLASIVDPDSGYPALQVRSESSENALVFPDVRVAGTFWSSTPAEVDDSYLVVNFGLGDTTDSESMRELQRSEPNYEVTFNVRCVR